MLKHNIKACLNTQRPDKNGLYPLRIRTTIQRKVTFYPTGIMLKKTEFKNGLIVNRAGKDLLNIELRNQIAKIEKDLLEASITGEAFTKAKKVADITFKDFAEKDIKRNIGLWSKSTVKHKKSYLAKVNEFKPGLKLKDITKDLLNEYEDFCRTVKKNNNNTIWTATKFFKTVVNTAVDDGVLQKNPLKGFKGVKYSDPMRSVLTQEEITLLEEFADNPLNNPKLTNVAAWFIFGCYTGLRYADMVEFKGLVNGKVLMQTQKTDAVVSIFATEQIQRAIGRLTKPIYTNQKCNDYIKAVCAILGIEKKISFHNSRHSFAVMFLENSGDIFLLSKILGHSTVKTTSIYSKVSSPLLDREMQKVFGK